MTHRLLVVLFAASGSGEQSGPLRGGPIPNQNPQEVEAPYEPFAEYLPETLGREVELSVPTSYNAVVGAMASDEPGLAYFGGLAC